MDHSGRFDRAGLRLIHFGLVLMFLLALAACTEDTLPEKDAGVVPAPVDAGTPLASLGDLDTEPPEPQTGLIPQGEQILAQAIGQAPKGFDLSLSRDRAAARARLNLYKLLKDKGIIAPDDPHLAGARIERIWVRGKRVYALAQISIPASPAGLNQSPADPSKHSEDSQPDAAAPTGGVEP